MRALCWHGRYDVRCDTVPDPKIEQARDVIIKVTACAICGSDLHLYDGYIPTMESGDILGHEFMGEVVETGAAHTKFKVGDRIVVPFTICCGDCPQCLAGNWSVCERSNPNGAMAAKAYGHPTAGLYGYSHMTGGFSGGQAEFVRVPYADVTPVKVPDELTDEQVLFLTDIFPTGYQAAVNCDIQPTDTVAVWGCGPVAQFAIRSVILLGAKHVIAIDRVPERLEMARRAGAEVIDFSKEDVFERLQELTHGRGPEKVIDCVGMEAHGGGTVQAVVDRVEAAAGIATDRITALRQAIISCQPAGIVSIPGVYGGLLNHAPMRAAFQKGLTFRMGQTHVNRYIGELMTLILEKKIDPSFVITHRLGLEVDQKPIRPSRRSRTAVLRWSCGPETADQRCVDVTTGGGDKVLTPPVLGRARASGGSRWGNDRLWRV